MSKDNFYKQETWGPGPWDNEPDKLQFTTEAGLKGMILRNGFGALCGYVAVDPSHPWYGNSYNTCTEDLCAAEYCYEHTPDYLVRRVHGGLTYAGATGGRISLELQEGESEELWLFGFDCAHSSDYTPYNAYSALLTEVNPAQYRTLEYVKEQVESLAKQLVQVNEADA